MRVLLLYPEQPLSFWSVKQGCILQGKKSLLPPLGLITVAALLPANWELKLVDLNIEKLTDAHWNWAELVMISGMIVQQENMLALIGEGKRRNKPVVCGGPYPSSLPQPVMEAGCDLLVRGEVENIVTDLIEAIEQKKTGLVLMDRNKPELSRSPIPRFDLLDTNAYCSMAIQTSRGCPFDCEFCDITAMYGRITRHKEPEQVLSELDELYRLGWKRDIFVNDDNFIGNRTKTRKLLDVLTPWMKSRGEPFSFTTQTSLNLGQDLDLVDRMTAANFNMVFIGVESPDEEILINAGKHQNVKNPLVESLNNITANGLDVMASFIIGFDNEKPGVGQRIAALVEKTGIPVPMLNLLQILPNTKLWDRLEKEGRLIPDRTTGQSTGTVLNFIPTRPPEDIFQEYIDTWEHLFEPTRFLNRSCRYYQFMRPTRSAMAKKSDRPALNSNGNSEYKRSIKQKLETLRAFLILSFWQGICSPSRRTYWKNLYKIMNNNPSRKVKYLSSCGLAECMIQMRDVIKERCRAEAGAED